MLKYQVLEPDKKSTKSQFVLKYFDTYTVLFNQKI